jgi:hypothetical protein
MIAGLRDCGIVGLWDCGIVGLWDCGIAGLRKNLQMRERSHIY